MPARKIKTKRKKQRKKKIINYKKLLLAGELYIHTYIVIIYVYIDATVCSGEDLSGTACTRANCRPADDSVTQIQSRGYNTMTVKSYRCIT